MCEPQLLLEIRPESGDLRTACRRLASSIFYLGLEASIGGRSVHQQDGGQGPLQRVLV